MPDLAGHGSDIVVTIKGVFVITIRTLSLSAPGLSSWMPSCFPLTVALADWGTFGKCRKVPSSIFTINTIVLQRALRRG